jgi:hypothetical protein
MSRRVAATVTAGFVALTFAGCGSTTSTEIAASAKSDHHASTAACSQEKAGTVRLGGQSFVVYDCVLSGVDQIYRPPGVHSPSFRSCYVFNQGAVEVNPGALRRVAPRKTFSCASV